MNKQILDCTIIELLNGDVKNKQIAIKMLVASIVTEVAKSKEKVIEDSEITNEKPILKNREMAQSVIDRLLDNVKKYGRATCSELNELMGNTSTLTDYEYGWTDLSKAISVRVKDGYLLQFPGPILLFKSSIANKKTRNKGSYESDQIIFGAREDAESVLSTLVELIKDYDMASVADFKDLSGIASPFTDNKYGWTDLKEACVRRVKHGYVIDLPKPIDLNEVDANKTETATKNFCLNKITTMSGFKNRKDAEDILNDLLDVVKSCGQVSVANLYTLVGINTTCKDGMLGWSDLSKASITRGLSSYELILPNTIELEY